MNRKQLWLLAGGNGAGKSTFYRIQLEPLGLPFINADIIAREIYPDAPEEHSYDAAILAEKLRLGLLHEGRSFCFETVFSHPSKIDFVAHAKSLGYEIILIFIHLDSERLNRARVMQRVEEGGHNVPSEKIAARIPRAVNHIRAVIPLCDQVRILDNSSAEDPFRLIATIRNGQREQYESELPEWSRFLLKP